MRQSKSTILSTWKFVYLPVLWVTIGGVLVVIETNFFTNPVNHLVRMPSKEELVADQITVETTQSEKRAVTQPNQRASNEQRTIETAEKESSISAFSVINHPESQVMEVVNVPKKVVSWNNRVTTEFVNEGEEALPLFSSSIDTPKIIKNESGIPHLERVIFDKPSTQATNKEQVTKSAGRLVATEQLAEASVITQDVSETSSTKVASLPTNSDAYVERNESVHEPTIETSVGQSQSEDHVIEESEVPTEMSLATSEITTPDATPPQTPETKSQRLIVGQEESEVEQELANQEQVLVDDPLISEETNLTNLETETSEAITVAEFNEVADDESVAEETMGSATESNESVTEIQFTEESEEQSTLSETVAE
ncbi:MAG: hypothetical protein ACK5MW_07570 [Enterococcus sp.]